MPHWQSIAGGSTGYNMRKSASRRGLFVPNVRKFTRITNSQVSDQLGLFLRHSSRSSFQTLTRMHTFNFVKSGFRDVRVESASLRISLSSDQILCPKPTMTPCRLSSAVSASLSFSNTRKAHFRYSYLLSAYRIHSCFCPFFLLAFCFIGSFKRS